MWSEPEELAPWPSSRLSLTLLLLASTAAPCVGEIRGGKSEVLWAAAASVGKGGRQRCIPPPQKLPLPRPPPYSIAWTGEGCRFGSGELHDDGITDHIGFLGGVPFSTSCLFVAGRGILGWMGSAESLRLAVYDLADLYSHQIGCLPLRGWTVFEYGMERRTLLSASKSTCRFCSFSRLTSCLVFRPIKGNRLNLTRHDWCIHCVRIQLFPEMDAE